MLNYYMENDEKGTLDNYFSTVRNYLFSFPDPDSSLLLLRVSFFKYFVSKNKDKYLGNGFWMVVHAVGQLSVVVQDKPSPLPSFGSKHKIVI